MITLDFLHRELGITGDLLESIGLPKHDEEKQLVVADIGPDGKEKLLTLEASKYWGAMRAHAQSDGVFLYTYSAYRSYEFQYLLIKDRMSRGETIQKALQRLAPPGYSEHHTGRAVDITTPASPNPTQSFDSSLEFSWLTENASYFGFHMSYPMGNPHGLMYEPWHWCFHPAKL